MKQLTKEQAFAFYKSGQWKDLDEEEIVKLQLFQERLCVPLEVYHKACNKVFDREVFSHEFSSDNYQNLVDEYLGKRPDPTLEEIFESIKDKVIFIPTGE